MGMKTPILECTRSGLLLLISCFLLWKYKPVTIVSIMSSNLAVLKMGKQFILHVLPAKYTRQLGLYITSDLLNI